MGVDVAGLPGEGLLHGMRAPTRAGRSRRHQGACLVSHTQVCKGKVTSVERKGMTSSETTSTAEELARETDESASDVIGDDVFPRPVDCGMAVDGVAFQQKAG